MTLAGFKASNHPQQTGKRGAIDAVDDRRTPQDFFDALSDRFGGFTLDVAASADNAKCHNYYTIEDDGIDRRWFGSVWCNPPYSDCRAWVEKAWDEWWTPDSDVWQIVMLLPANRTEQKWWQELVEPQRRLGELDVEFLPGRMRFERPNWTPGPKGDRPPFGLCLLIWGERR